MLKGGEARRLISSSLVAVSQAEDELFAPLRAQLTYFGLLLAFVALVTLAIAFWLSVHYAAPVLDPDTDMHLVEHPAVHQIDEETVQEAER